MNKTALCGRRAIGALACGLLLQSAACVVPAQAAEQNSAGHRFSIVAGADGVPLNVVEVGDPSRPAILLIHGIGQSHHSFDLQLQSPELASKFHLVAFDLRGHGFSGKPWTKEAYVISEKWADDLQHVIAATHLKNVVLVGWSYGSLVVADYLRKYGTRDLAGIVLAGAYGGLTDPPSAPRTLTPAVLAEMARNREQQLSGDMDERRAAVRQAAKRLTAKPMSDSWMDSATNMGMLTAAEARRFMFDRPLDNKSLVARIDVRLLVVIGGKDGSTPEPEGRDLAKRVPHGAVSFYPQSGHSAFAEFPQRFNDELATFAASSQPARAP